MMLHYFLYSIYVVAALVITVKGAPQPNTLNEPVSPCPNLFRYDSINEPGQWTGNLLIPSEDDLYGVWLRLIFDNPVTKIIVDGDYEAVLPTDKNEVLIKNRNILLKAGSETDLRLTVKYDGTRFPNLSGYRLNAKVLCPVPNTNRTDFFQGDESSKDFLTTVLLNTKPTNLLAAYKCGIKPPNSSTYPWQAALYVKQNNKEQYACEATLISPSHVVTAAHCVTFKNENTEVPLESVLVHLQETEKLTVTKIKVHPAYDPNGLLNDVAILQLKTVLPISDYVRPICLGNKQSIGSVPLLTGYEIRDGKIGNELAEASIEKLVISDCVKRAPELKNILGGDTYCVTYLSSNPHCVGDSGSSLVSVNNDIATLKGIVSVGVLLQNRNDCNQDTVAVITDVSKLLKWILHAMS